MTCVRTGAGVVVGAAVLSMLAGCASAPGSSAVFEVSSAAPAPNTSGSAPVSSSVAAESIFAGSAPVSIVTWWAKHPSSAPADLAEHTLLFDERGSGPQRFRGPDMRKYDKVLMVITCSRKVEYSLRLQVLDGLSIATTAGDSCGGPELSSYVSPPLKVVEPRTEVEVEVPAGTSYYVTIYGTAAD